MLNERLIKQALLCLSHFILSVIISFQTMKLITFCIFYIKRCQTSLNNEISHILYLLY